MSRFIRYRLLYYHYFIIDTKMDDNQNDSLISLSKGEQVKIIDLLLQDFDVDFKPSLDFVIDLEPIHPVELIQSKTQLKAYRNREDNSKYENILTYTIPGSKLIRRSQNSNLVGKIKQFEKIGYQSEQIVKKNLSKKLEVAKIQSEESDIERQEGDKKSDGQQIIELEQDQPDKKYRYYKNDFVICHKCKKKGHYLNMCPQPTLCLFCLSPDHICDDCPQKNVCYKCYLCGHMINQCSERDVYLSRCNKCERNHEGECYFLTRGKERTKKMFKLDHMYRNADIRCPKCLQFGHIECFY